ncbi:DNA polymerase III subunit alpha [Bernardetia sp. MNP-M8]|uniref:DNA polymerase III subunit alpha n=1 Tax=Bernardetia sp. MNP-M8 TaxID=3127470 RepID=UPI0030CB79A2
MYLVFDTETTGLPKNFNAPVTDSENWPRLVQIAWQLHDKTGNLLSAQNHIVYPDGFTIPFNAEKVHGISTKRAEENGKPLSDVLNAFADDYQKADILIGHNVEFDVAIMGAEFHRTSIERGFMEKETLCTKLTSVDFVAIQGGRGGRFKWPTLTELHTKLFGVPFADAHDAAYDVDATAKCFFGLLQNKVVPTVEDITPEMVVYQAPELDKANFGQVQKKSKASDRLKKDRKLDEILPFVHLHTHSQFSILQSTANVKKLVSKAHEMGMPAIAITDIGNMHGAFYAVGEGEKLGIKVIIGAELHLTEDRHKHKFTKDNPDRRTKQVFLAKNQAGYHNLAKMCSYGYVDGYYAGVPRIDRELIVKYKENVIATTGGIGSEIPQLILNVGELQAEEAFQWWLEEFRDDFYIQLQRHGLEEEERVNEILLSWADKYDVKYFASNDCFYLKKEDADAHDTLLCVKDGIPKSTPVGRGRGYRFGFPNHEFYFKSAEEMNQLFADLPESIETTMEIVNKTEVIKLKRDILLPKYEIPAEFPDEDAYLAHLAYEGAAKRYKEITPAIRERIDLELKIMKDMGFPGYFLIVQDFINEARRIGVAVGPGRGCLTADAKVVLHDGTTKNICDIEKGDKVITESGTIRKVKNTFVYPTNNKEELLKIKTYYGETEGITLTKDHKILTEKQLFPKNYENWAESTKKNRAKPRPIGNLEWKQAQEISEGDWVFVPKPKVEIKEIKEFDLADLSEYSALNDLRFDEETIYHDVQNTLCNTIQRTKTQERKIILDKDWYKIFGIFTGDGWIRKNERPLVGFAFHESEKENLNFVKNKFEQIGCEVSENHSKTRKLIQLAVNSKPIYLLFKKLYDEYEFSSATKYVPDFVLSASEENVASFLEGYCAADGYEGEGKFRFTTVSRKLADQVRFLCWRINIPASLGIDNRIDKREAFKNTQTAYYVTIPKDKRIGKTAAKANYIYEPIKNEKQDGFLLKIRSVETVPNQTLVYDFEVEEEHNYLTSSFLVHNSAAGSVVAYCIGITNIDPILYNLLFERFLNPERVSMPDIDVDFDDVGRQSVIDYVVKKYGRNQVAQIVTYGTMAAKMSIKDVARVMELPLDESNRIAKLVPEKPGTTLDKAFDEVEELRQIFRAKDLQGKVLQNAKVLEGSVRNTGTHAAGVIIAPDDITEYIPVCTAKDADLFITQFDGKVVEDAGMLKMDFLGLKTLTIIKDAIDLIEKNHGIRIDPDEIPIDDVKAYELYQRGDTVGTFQFESDGMRKYLKELKPTNIEDLIAMNALYRPGPMDFIPSYIDRKHGRETVEYPHELLKPILEPTFGIMIYQEQIMQAAQIMGGYSLGGADILRRAMGKKKAEEMAKQKSIFVEGAKKTHGIDKKKAEEVFEVMEKFAAYGFNRSHSAAYSVVAFQTGYLKAHYPAEYMAAVMTNNMSSIDKITFFIDEAQRIGVPVLGPDVNESIERFGVNDKGQIRFGLAAIKGAGETAVSHIITEREEKGKYEDIFNFVERMDLSVINKRTFEALTFAGGLDCFEEVHRAQIFAPTDTGKTNLELLLAYSKAQKEEAASAQVSMFGGADGKVEVMRPRLAEIEPWTEIDKLNKEKEVVGFFISGHPLDQYKIEMKTNCSSTLLNLANARKGTEVKVGGMIIEVAHRKTASGRDFGLFTLEDYSGSYKFALFGKEYDHFKGFLIMGEFLLITGRMEERYNNPDQVELKIKNISLLSDVKQKPISSINIAINLLNLNETLIMDLENLFNDCQGGDCKIKMEFFHQAPQSGRTFIKTVSHHLQINPTSDLVRDIEQLGVVCQVG